MFLINTLLVVLPIGLTFGETRTFSFTAEDVCYEQYNDVISDVDHVMSLMSCSVLCADDDCCSFMFNAESQHCITSSAYAESFNQGECGWKYVEINKNDCKAPSPTEVPLTYICENGHIYDPETEQCVIECGQLGSTFGVFDKYRPTIDWKSSSYTSVTNCLIMCLNITSFTCRTASYYDAFCYLSDVRGINNMAILPNDNVTLYVRNCA